MVNYVDIICKFIICRTFFFLFIRFITCISIYVHFNIEKATENDITSKGRVQECVCTQIKLENRTKQACDGTEPCNHARYRRRRGGERTRPWHWD